MVDPLDPLDLVQLRALMAQTEGSAEFSVGLIDGPVALGHPDLSQARVREIGKRASSACSRVDSAACQHGTFVAAMLVARRGATATAICPGCTLVVRPIFAEDASEGDHMPVAAPEDLATAIFDTVDAGARVINLSAGLMRASSSGEHELSAALDYSARRGVLVVAAAGNEGTIGSSVITRHPWVIPVAGCDSGGAPSGASNVGRSIGAHGLRAPCENITSLATTGGSHPLTGTSAAAPFVTGAIALLGSEFPGVRSEDLKLAVIRTARGARKSLVPPLLDAWTAYQAIGSFNA